MNRDLQTEGLWFSLPLCTNERPHCTSSLIQEPKHKNISFYFLINSTNKIFGVNNLHSNFCKNNCSSTLVVSMFQNLMSNDLFAPYKSRNEEAIALFELQFELFLQNSYDKLLDVHLNKFEYKFSISTCGKIFFIIVTWLCFHGGFHCYANNAFILFRCAAKKFIKLFLFSKISFRIPPLLKFRLLQFGQEFFL